MAGASWHIHRGGNGDFHIWDDPVFFAPKKRKLCFLKVGWKRVYLPISYNKIFVVQKKRKLSV